MYFYILIRIQKTGIRPISPMSTPREVMPLFPFPLLISLYFCNVLFRTILINFTGSFATYLHKRCNILNIIQPPAYLWDVVGNQRTQRKPKQSQRKHANSTPRSVKTAALPFVSHGCPFPLIAYYRASSPSFSIIILEIEKRLIDQPEQMVYMLKSRK